MVSRRDCPILWMIPCYLYELPPSRYFLFNSICFLCGLCDVSDSVCLFSFWSCPGEFVHVAPLAFQCSVPCGVVPCSSQISWLPSAWLLLFPIFPEAHRGWMKSVHSTWVFIATHESSFFQDFLFLCRFSFLNFLPSEHFPLLTAVFIPPSSCTVGML